MADRPILFSAPMVRALLAGTKTQTRRVLTPQPHREGAFWRWHGGGWSEGNPLLVPGHSMYEAMRNKPGDRLWVREAWAPLDGVTRNDPGVQALADCGFYRADNSTVEGEINRWRPSIHMPRWASRLTLTVTDVRVQRLQDISEEDAIAEGIEDVTHEVASSDRSLRFWKRYRDGGWNGYVDTAIGSYASLWTEINGAGAWAANPWVVAYSFTVDRRNIDEAPHG